MATPHNLPSELSSFVGRERQLAELRRLLRKSRLITLTGPGGAGKTRLALRLAANVLDRHPDGVWLVDLAALNDARLLEQTVASACGVREQGVQPMLRVLVEYLVGRRSLLILDSCEHLVDACAALAESLLRSCPKLTILVTSREPLGVPGELIWRTPSLSLPRSEDGDRPELVLESEAVRLYIDRAQMSRAGFYVDSAEATAAVAQICARLEGMPLAIELAASLTRVMAPEEILDRLRDRFRLLTGGSRSALPRHQTLRKAVDWSYGLLSPAEKMLLARLSVFAGGFDLAAAEAVSQDEPLHPGGVLQVLSRLVDKSLVSAETAGPTGTRYRMLDTIREYALEKLQDGDEADARRRHASYYVAYCGHAANELRGVNPLPWLARLDEEQANIRLALGWAMTEQPEDALRLAAAMGTYWHPRRHYAEAAEWLNQTLELPTPNLEARAKVHGSRASIRWRYGDYDGARLDAEECARLSRQLGLGIELSTALTTLGLVSGAMGDQASGERYTTESIQVARELQYREGTARGLNNLAMFVSQRGDHEQARMLLEQSWAEIQLAGNRAAAGNILDSLARVSLLLGDQAAARRYYLDSLQQSTKFGDAINIVECLEGIALLDVAERDAIRAIRLISAANVIRLANNFQAMPYWAGQVQEGLAAARASLGGPAAETAWKAGAAMSGNEAIHYASGAAPSPTNIDLNPLTGRETQVAALIAEGLTNAEIAARLRMAARTADAHVEHIRNKLGLRSRSQIAVWAHERLGKA
jgi:predicted ATPase/DNA-binding CsgD family transcriptional regulator